MDFFFPGIETLKRVRDQERRRSEKRRRERKVSDVKDREKGIFVTKLTFQKCFSFFNKCVQLPGDNYQVLMKYHKCVFFFLHKW